MAIVEERPLVEERDLWVAPEDDRETQPLPGPAPIKVRLRPPERAAARTRFRETDPPVDVTRLPVVGKLIAQVLASRKFQFFAILPNQIVFWAVILLGLIATWLTPNRSFGVVITWYWWFALVFVMMVVVGRMWCNMCPFGGFAEWLQRKAFWKRTQKALGLGWKMPERWAGHGLLLSAIAFIVLTWFEEFFNIAGPGPAYDTSWMVVSIIGSAIIFFLVFERRTFCRYVCPLSSLIGSVGGMGTVAGFRTRDREKCISCPTKDCMRGNESAFGCPWYTWPGSAETNLFCGLCSECYKACPYDNVGLYVQKPLTSVVAPLRRRFDVAIAVALLLGLVVFQQVNALNVYASVDGWLTKYTKIPYPNPIDYVLGIAAATLVVLACATVMRAVLARREVAVARGKAPVGALATKGESSGATKKIASSWRQWFLPLAYGLIPITGADYFSRQVPKLYLHAPRVIASVAQPLGWHTGLYNLTIIGQKVKDFGSLPNHIMWQVIGIQVGLMGVGLIASLWVMDRIARRDLVKLSDHPVLARALPVFLVLAIGLCMMLLYIPMQAAT